MNSSLFLVCCFAVAQAVISTFFSLLCALPCVYFFSRFNFRIKKTTLALIPLLCIMPSKVVAQGIHGMMPQGFAAIIWAHVVLNTPLAFFMIYNAHCATSFHWRLIAQELGATEWQAYKDIELPYLKGTLLSCATVIFLLCFTSISVPHIVGSSFIHLTPDILLLNAYQAHDLQAMKLCWLLRLLIVLPFCFFSTKKSQGWFADTMEHVSASYTFQKCWQWWPVIIGLISVVVLLPFVSFAWHAYTISIIFFCVSIIKCEIDSVLKIPLYRVILNSFFLALISGIGSVIIGYVLCKTMRYARSFMVKTIVTVLSIGVFLLGNVGCALLFLWINHYFLFSRFVLAILCHTILNYVFAYGIINAHLNAWQSEWTFLAQSFGAQTAGLLVVFRISFFKKIFYAGFLYLLWIIINRSRRRGDLC